jgi:hypothetical protein
MASYDFKKVSLIVDGTFITGFMDGSAVKAEKNTDNVTPHVGAAGEVTYAENGDNTGTITINLKAGSASLPKLVTLATAKREFNTSIVDANTNAYRAGGNTCRVIKTPSVEWGSEITGVEIKIHVADFSLLTA